MTHDAQQDDGHSRITRAHPELCSGELKMIKLKKISVQFAPHITLMLLLKFQKNLASSFGEDY